MRLGKLDNDDLERLILHKLRHTRSESLCAPEIGQDCAVLDLDNDLVVLSSDPITSAGIGQIGRLTVHVSCNDAAAAGAEPVGLLVTLLVPPNATEGDIDRIANDLSSAASDAGVDILGGHTEITDCVTRMVTCATVVARQSKSGKLRGLLPGDDVVMTKYAGLEGTTILAGEYADRLRALPEGMLDEALALTGCLSVVPESKIALQNGATAMHDVTEGGILGAAWEMAYVGNCGVCIDLDRIPVLPVTQQICDVFGLDALRLISSGSMLIACIDGDALVAALCDAGIPAVKIGKACGTGLTTVDGTKIEAPGADEIYRVTLAQ